MQKPSSGLLPSAFYRAPFSGRFLVPVALYFYCSKNVLSELMEQRLMATAQSFCADEKMYIFIEKILPMKSGSMLMRISKCDWGNGESWFKS
jgi:hypothetical protein